MRLDTCRRTPVVLRLDSAPGPEGPGAESKNQESRLSIPRFVFPVAGTPQHLASLRPQLEAAAR